MSYYIRMSFNSFLKSFMVVLVFTRSFLFWFLKSVHLIGIVLIAFLILACFYFKLSIYLTVLVSVFGLFVIWGSVESFSTLVTQVEIGDKVIISGPFYKSEITRVKSIKLITYKANLLTMTDLEINTGSKVETIEDIFTLSNYNQLLNELENKFKIKFS